MEMCSRKGCRHGAGPVEECCAVVDMVRRMWVRRGMVRVEAMVAGVISCFGSEEVAFVEVKV